MITDSKPRFNEKKNGVQNKRRKNGIALFRLYIKILARGGDNCILTMTYISGSEESFVFFAGGGDS